MMSKLFFVRSQSLHHHTFLAPTIRMNRRTTMTPFKRKFLLEWGYGRSARFFVDCFPCDLARSSCNLFAITLLSQLHSRRWQAGSL